MEPAIALAAFCGQCAEWVTRGLGRSRIGALEGKLLGLLQREPLSTGEALRRLRISADELHRMCRSLEATGLITVTSKRTLANRTRIILQAVA